MHRNTRQHVSCHRLYRADYVAAPAARGALIYRPLAGFPLWSDGGRIAGGGRRASLRVGPGCGHHVAHYRLHRPFHLHSVWRQRRRLPCWSHRRMPTSRGRRCRSLARSAPCNRPCRGRAAGAMASGCSSCPLSAGVKARISRPRPQ